ncbi:Uncharacterized protein HZ326_26686 [Fusarium oxysporum f. sp. albedinis]|nr:Uncharacterized protein HZ326_26686 [Fusarium oxysporum f. sp. albedinis]
MHYKASFPAAIVSPIVPCTAIEDLILARHRFGCKNGSIDNLGVYHPLSLQIVLDGLPYHQGIFFFEVTS